MPWRETAPVDERSRFIDAYRAGGFTMTGAARHIAARTASTTPRPSCCARHDGNIATGGRRSSSTGSGPVTPA